MRPTAVGSRFVVFVSAVALLAAGLVALGQVQLASAAAVAQSPAKARSVKANTMKVRVAGQRLGKRAKLKVTGVKGKAKGFKRVVSVKKAKRLTGLRRGVYKVRARNITKGAAKSKPTPRVQRVKVTNKAGGKALVAYERVADATASTSPASRIPSPALDEPEEANDQINVIAQGQGMPTTHCTHKGTRGDDTLDVAFLPGETVVVCTGSGEDVVNLLPPAGSGAIDKKTNMWIAHGPGQKTVNWLVGDLSWNNLGDQNNGIIVRPDGQPPIKSTNCTITPQQPCSGVNKNPLGAWFKCGTNTDFQTTRVWKLMPATLLFWPSSPPNDYYSVGC